MKKSPHLDIDSLLAGVPEAEFLEFAKEYFGSHSEMQAAGHVCQGVLSRNISQPAGSVGGVGEGEMVNYNHLELKKLCHNYKKI